MSARLPSIWTLTWRLGSSGGRVVRLTTCAQKRAKSGHSIQRDDQRLVTSDVQAITRPRPYCHSDRIGSIWRETSRTLLCGLGVVAT